MSIIIKNFFLNKLNLFVVSVFFMVMSSVWYYYEKSILKIEYIAPKIEHKLQLMDKEFFNLIDNSNSINKLIDTTYTEKDIITLSEKTFSLLIYKDKKLIFWNNNYVSIPDNVLIDLKNGASFIKLKNGIYKIIKSNYRDTKLLNENEYTILGLQLIKYEYPNENKYLKNSANPYLEASENIDFSTEKKDTNAYIIENKDTGSKLYLSQTNNSTISNYAIIFIIQLLSIFLLLGGILAYFNKLGDKKNLFVVLLAFTFLLIGIRILLYYLQYPFDAKIFEIFKSVNSINTQTLTVKTFLSKLFYNSLGDTIISNLFLFVNSIFYYKRFRNFEEKNKIFENKREILVFVLLQIWVSISSIVSFGSLKYLILNFSLFSRVGNIDFFNIDTFWTLFCILLVVISHFLIIKRTAVLFDNLKIPFKSQLLIVLIVLFVILIGIYFLNFEKNFYLALAYIFLYFILINTKLPFLKRELNLKSIFIFIFIFSFLTSNMMYYYSIQKEHQARELFAESISFQQDPITESLYHSVTTNIYEDKTIDLLLKNPMFAENELETRMKKKYFSGHFNKYETKVLPFLNIVSSKKQIDKNNVNDAENVLEQNDLVFNQLKNYEELIAKSIRTNTNDLYIIPSSIVGNNYYLGKIPIFGENEENPTGFVIVELHDKDDIKSNVYPELTVEDRLRENEINQQYSYALYEKNILSNQHGAYSYNYTKDSIFLPKNYLPIGEQDTKHSQFDTTYLKNNKSFFVNYNNYSHYVYLSSPLTTVIVSQHQETIWQFFSLFLQVFGLGVIISFLAIILNSFFKTTSDTQFVISSLFYSSLRNRINTYMIILMLVSLIIVGAVTIGYFYFQFVERNQQRLIQKQKEVLIELENTLRERWTGSNIKNEFIPKNSDFLNGLVKLISESHGIDINIFDKNGEIISSSQPVIYQNGLLSNQMNILAFYHLKKLSNTQFTQKEIIGKLTYDASYVPIFDSKGALAGFLNLPYFAKEKELRTELSGFLITLLNVYIIIILLAALSAFIIGQTISKPLTQLSDKLKNFKLGQKNELLEWTDKDEIGMLIQQYNATIKELDHSVKLLQQSEREMAWQEMARQVAHEIKNPLTPMKLSIQLLQRAYKDNRTDVSQIADKVTRTLIEQIDTLSHIASEFSNFAKMPQASNEVINITDLLQNVVNLHSEEVAIQTDIPDAPYLVYSDKSQLLRVFNNLIKNAIQAIPDLNNGLIIVALNPNSEYVIASVSDNGCGIDAEKAEKVFSPNFTTKNSGMGLGLSMSKTIVEGIKGEIWFKSAVDIGTTFYVKIPLFKNE